MQVALYQDEWWPVYSIHDDLTFFTDHHIELSEEDHKRYTKIFKEFQNMQQELRELYEKS